MLVLLLCCMMKIVEFSTGKPVNNNIVPSRGKRRKKFKKKGKAMNEIGSHGVKGLTPDSDCNSNHHNSTSYLSNTSSQDIDFIQDNSDYQWFLDYGYRDGGVNHHTSILSLPETYETNEINYYDTFSKNMDANLAEADMESFRTEDIHALLTNLPPMCTDHLSQENNRQGESYASVTGSLMGKFDFDSSLSPHSSSHDADSNSMSICKSELLFSPVKEVPPMPGVNFSVDSLDCDMMLTCQANKDNYTIAFEGSVTMYSEDSDFHETDKSENSTTGSVHWIPINLKKQNNNSKILDSSMTQSDCGTLTTWSKLKKLTSDNQLRRLPSGNNNNSSDDSSALGLSENTMKSQSMPNLHKQKIQTILANNYMKNKNLTNTTVIKRKPVKVFDIQHQMVHNSNGSLSDMATSVDVSCSDNTSNNKQPNFSLVKLFMKQKSMSTEGMSITMDQLSSTSQISDSNSNSSEHKIDHNMKNLDISSDQRTNDSSIRTYDLIAEEPEDGISRSDSMEQLPQVQHFDININEKREIFNVNNNNSILLEKNCKKLTSKSIQTSNFSEITNLKNANKINYEKLPSIKIIEPSFLKKLKQEGEIQKPVYVLYPNYVLPNLDFLNEKQNNLENFHFIPQATKINTRITSKKRPFSCNDLELLKKKGFSHVRDWDSLNFLLPQEYRTILSEVPEISKHISSTNSKEKSSYIHGNRKRPMSCDYTHLNHSSSSSTTTQPSSGYRGSSSILTDSQNSPAPNTNLNPLFVYRYDSVTSSEASFVMGDKPKPITTAPPLPVRCVSLQQQQQQQQQNEIPPRPPLPKGILRKGLEKIDPTKRYSLYETSEEELLDDVTTTKRKSENLYFQRNKRLSETEDEGVDAGTSSSSLDEHHESMRPSTPLYNNKTDFLLSNMGMDELAQLEEFLKISGISATSDNEEINEENLMQLRSYVGKFLSLKINQEGSEHFGGKKSVSFAEKINIPPKFFENKQIAPNNSPNVSAHVYHKNYQTKLLMETPICEENENNSNLSSPQNSPTHKTISNSLLQKRLLVSGVTEAVEKIINLFSSASNQNELNMLGDSSLNPTCAKLILSHLCPALYSALSDGLKPSLESSFGAINNSVWQVVEASAQQGPLTKALNELVMRINSEDIITEGLVKFNAFIFGLLNVRSLDAWMSYLRTRESILKKHYTTDSLLIMSNTGGTTVRILLDALIEALQPLALLPFQMDLLFEYRQLHLSFKRMEQLSPSHKLSPSPNFKQWNSSCSSNRSNSDSEEISAATTIRYCPSNNRRTTNLNSPKRNDKERPRSCIESTMKPNFKLGDVSKKRWSGISMNSKLYLVYDKLAKEEEEEYTDSLENYHGQRLNEEKSDNDNVPSLQEDGPESLDSNFSDDKPINGRRFKKLQQKWEMLSGRDVLPTLTPSPAQTPTNKSKIPRPISSPNRTSGIPILTSPNTTKLTTTKLMKKPSTPTTTTTTTTSNYSSNNNRITTINKIKTKPPLAPSSTNTRTSRVDSVETSTPKHIPRPSSLPYKTTSSTQNITKINNNRRATSSSSNRKPLNNKSLPQFVKTISHRLPSESGHLPYREGDRLKVVLEVDDKWLLCCRGTQKGLVPKTAVITDLARF